MSKPHAPRAGDLVGRNYTLERSLGEGGMGQVYLARHAVTGRRVALKWVRTDDAVMRERVLREARSMGRLSHPNVVGVLDAGEHLGGVFVVMEYVEGADLRSHARKHPELTVAAKLDLLLPAMSGVAAAHQAGILHRDLKPENLFVCTDVDGSAYDTKVLDFGVAKSSGEGEATLTSTGAIVGTPKYMAPEQISHGDDVDERMDVYALGLILYELLAGRLPYASTSLKTMVIEILAGRITPLAELAPQLPPQLCEAVMKALANERDDRFPDVASFADAVQAFAERQVFEPPRGVHTPDLSVAEVTSPEFESLSAEHKLRASQRAPAAAPTVSKPRRRGGEGGGTAPSRGQAPTQRDSAAGAGLGMAEQVAATQRSVPRPVVAVAATAAAAAAGNASVDATGTGSRATGVPYTSSRSWWVLAAVLAAAIGLGFLLQKREQTVHVQAAAGSTAAQPVIAGTAPAAVPEGVLAGPVASPMAAAGAGGPALPAAALPAAAPPAAAEVPGLPAAAAEPTTALPAAGLPAGSQVGVRAPASGPPRETRLRRERRAAAVQPAATTAEPTATTRGGVLRKGDF